MGGTGSGRRPLCDETIKVEVLEIAWRRLKEILSSDRVSNDKKDDICVKLAEKSIPKDINLGSQEGNPLGLTINIVKPECKSNPS